MHPAHVPLEAEAEAAEERRARDARPGGRLLGRHDRAGLAAVHDLVELLEEPDRLEILAAAVLVRDPLPRLARVVAVQHRGHGIDADAVDVVLLEPEERVGDEEVAHLGAAVVEDERAPVGVRAAPRVGVLVERRAVEAHERELVAREVRRHPVEDHAEAALVQAVDERAELVGRAVARGRGEVARHLVAPRARERMLHDRHQLDVREVEAERVVGELVGELRVGQRAVALERVEAPRAEVHLVDRHRRAVRLGRPAPLDPGVVAPRVLRTRRSPSRCAAAARRARPRGRPSAARRRRRRGSRTCSRARARPPGTKSSQTPVLPSVRIGWARSFQALKSPTTATEQRGRRPDGEGGAARAVDLAHVRAERVPELLVAPLGDQVQVELAERRQEGVGVAHRHRRPVAVGRPRGGSRRAPGGPAARRRRRRRGGAARARRPRPRAAAGARRSPPGGTRARRGRRRCGAPRARCAGRGARPRRRARARPRTSRRHRSVGRVACAAGG